MTYTDQTLMPFGKHKGEKLANVPSSYLLWLWDNREGETKKLAQWYTDLFEYIEENLDAIKLDLKNQENYRKSQNKYNTR